ncbi:hypothetical protein AVEN_177887-1 [Araneus ventricosus]|uniref:Uncharacterized protein n=1 Tax=Araneus ventricosus TaxID=182803 RepID=A0A4Y1ZNE5_ARAVE|nr:hypothetical protein AVEN_140538-1 [Araneus ventricosus]GBL60201.1 hypothetical protein AVEN_177887-1 [Araneus ventricosus]
MHFEATLGLFWDRPCNIQPRSDDKEDTWAGPPPSIRITPAGGRLALTYDLTCNRTAYTADIQWNRVSNLEPSSSGAETLPLSHRGPS